MKANKQEFTRALLTKISDENSPKFSSTKKYGAIQYTPAKSFEVWLQWDRCPYPL